MSWARVSQSQARAGAVLCPERASPSWQGLNPAAFENVCVPACVCQGARWKKCSSLLDSCLVLSWNIIPPCPGVSVPRCVILGGAAVEVLLDQQKQQMIVHTFFIIKKDKTNIKLNKLQTFLSWLYIMHLSSKASEPLHVNIIVTLRSIKGR